MEVQIFMSEDNKALIYDNEQLDEFRNIVSEFNLICNNVMDSEKSPIPYMLLDEATIRAFKLLCPTTDDIKQYRFEIPLEILRHVKLSSTEKYFDWIEVWSNTKDPDPFCIGRVFKTDSDRKGNYKWNASTYLIGRWGAEAKSLDELMKIAIALATERISSYSSVCIAKMKSWQECPETWAKQYIYNNNTETINAIGSNSAFI